jgi:ferredoxin
MAAGAAASLMIKQLPFSSIEQTPFIRPPGSVPEDQFLTQCVRCGECVQACPTGTLQPASFEHSLDALWTPRGYGDCAGCDSGCNNCGQVCPTGAIRKLPLEEKNAARMGLAVIDEKTCLPLAQRQQCQACVDACQAAGYQAIGQDVMAAELDANDQPIAGTGFWIPQLNPVLCVGCLACQAACSTANVRDTRLLEKPAIYVMAGPGREDRMLTGSYIALRGAEAAKAQEEEESRK